MKNQRFFRIPFYIILAATLANGLCSTAFSQEEEPDTWDAAFEVVEIKSTLDGALQKAYAYDAETTTPAPLIVSLHTWSHDYTQIDGLAELFRSQNFNYIHPDFRGKNVTPESCASPLALQDIDDAIDYCLQNWNVDEDKIAVVGYSGGGHATSATYFKSKHKIKAFYAWATISDIEAWYHQTRQRELKYADEILQILGGTFDSVEARTRSPLYMPFQKRDAKLHLFAGINDGYNGSVPTSQSMRLYNRLCDEANESSLKITAEEQVALLSKSSPPTKALIEGRAIYLSRESSLSSLTIFEGGHDILIQHCFEAILDDLR